MVRATVAREIKGRRDFMEFQELRRREAKNYTEINSKYGKHKLIFKKRLNLPTQNAFDPPVCLPESRFVEGFSAIFLIPRRKGPIWSAKVSTAVS